MTSNPKLEVNPLTGFSKYFNTTTINGRVNVSKPSNNLYAVRIVKGVFNAQKFNIIDQIFYYFQNML